MQIRHLPPLLRFIPQFAQICIIFALSKFEANPFFREKKLMKIPKMSGGVNLAARVGRTFLKANLLVLKTKIKKFFQIFDECKVSDAYFTHI